MKDLKSDIIHVRAFPITNKRLKELANYFGVSESGIIQLAINDLCYKEGLITLPRLKYNLKMVYRVVDEIEILNSFSTYTK